MAVTVCKRWVIEGGRLKTPWVPSRLVDVGDAHFIELESQNSRLASFLGFQRVDQKHDSVLKALRHLRNEAIDELFLADIKENDPMGHYSCLPKGFNRGTSRATLPEYVEVDLPEVTAEGMTAETNMKILVERNPLKVIAMELSESNLVWLRLAVLAVDKGDFDVADLTASPPPKKKQRRGVIDLVELSSKHVQPDYRRRSLFTRYTNADGIIKRHYLKPTEWDTEAITTTERDLLVWLIQNHHEERDGMYVPSRRLPRLPKKDEDEESDSDAEGEVPNSDGAVEQGGAE